MKLAASNIALPAYHHAAALPHLRQMGLTGLEISPSRVWGDTWHGLSGNAVATYRRTVEAADLKVVGLDALLADHPELGLFKSPEAVARTADFLVHLSAVCRDLGGRTLVFNGYRRRDQRPLRQAWEASRAFLDNVLPRIEDHGTVLCFAPLGLAAADFCATAQDCRALVTYFEHPSLGLHLSASVQAGNNDTGHAPFFAVKGRLDHFHADEPDLAMFDSSRRVDHADFRRHLAAIGYRQWITLKQRMADDPLEGLGRSVRQFAHRYLRKDNLTLVLRRATPAPAGHRAAPDRLQRITTTIADIRPVLQEDGGDIELVGVDGDRITVRLTGACVNCSMASQTLGGIGRRLMTVLGAPVRIVPVAA